MGNLEIGKTGAIYRTPKNQVVNLKLIDNLSLPKAVEGGSTVREIASGVDREKRLQLIVAELSKDREVVEDEDGCLRVYDILGIGAAF